jgi:dipeptide/tripeptide permease
MCLGLKAILITYFVNYLNFEQEQAVGVVHAWIFAAYATAVLGGLISDAYLGM